MILSNNSLGFYGSDTWKIRLKTSDFHSRQPTMKVTCFGVCNTFLDVPTLKKNVFEFLTHKLLPLLRASENQISSDQTRFPLVILICLIYRFLFVSDWFYYH